MKLGCFCSMDNGLYGAVTEALYYKANTLMVYTGSPQSFKRKDISSLRIESGQELMQKHNITDLVVHAPFIINLASPEEDKRDLSIKVLREEYDRSKAMGARCLVVHPGNHMTLTREQGLCNIIDSLCTVLHGKSGVTICLETMAGKGTELCSTFEELAKIINIPIFKDKLGVCFDTCHVHDAGYDISTSLEEFQKYLPLEVIKVVHLNDSKNIRGSHKDRHENIGAGKIGFPALYNFCHDPVFEDIPIILETPNGLFKQEIELLRIGTKE